MYTRVPQTGLGPGQHGGSAFDEVLRLARQDPSLHRQLAEHFGRSGPAAVPAAVAHHHPSTGATHTIREGRDLIFFPFSEKSETEVSRSSEGSGAPGNASHSTSGLSDIFFGPGIVPVASARNHVVPVVAAPATVVSSAPASCSGLVRPASLPSLANASLFEGLPTPSPPASVSQSPSPPKSAAEMVFDELPSASGGAWSPLAAAAWPAVPAQQMAQPFAPLQPPGGGPAPPPSSGSNSGPPGGGPVPPPSSGPPNLSPPSSTGSASASAPAPVSSRTQTFQWKDFCVTFCFGSNHLKQNGAAKEASLSLPKKFSGDSLNALFELITFVVAFAKVVDQRGWDEKSASVLLRANVIGSAALLLHHRPAWRDLLDILFNTYGSAEALRVCRREVERISMTAKESPLLFLERVEVLLKVVRDGRSDHELARYFLDLVRPHQPSFPADTSACWYALESVYARPGSTLDDVKQVLLQHHLAAVRMLARGSKSEQKGQKDESSKDASKQVLCFDCGLHDVKVGHKGCSAPGTRKFAPANKGKESTGTKVQDAKSTTKKGKRVRFDAAAKSVSGSESETSGFSPNAMVRLTCANGRVLLATVDSAATNHFFPPSTVAELQLEMVPQAAEKVATAKAGEFLHVVGHVTVSVFLGDKQVAMKAFVSPEIDEPLLGFRAWLREHPGTKWDSDSVSGKESLYLSGVPFQTDPESDGHVWIPASISSDEFAARAGATMRTEQAEDTAVNLTKFAMSAARFPEWCVPIDSWKQFPRPLTFKELSQTSTFASKKERKGVFGKVLTEWAGFARDLLVKNGHAEWPATGWPKALAQAADSDHLTVLVNEMLDGVDVAQRTAVWDKSTRKAYKLASTVPLAPAMQRTTHADTKALERILQEMKEGGASDQDCSFFENEIFWPYENLRLASLGLPPKSRGPGLDFDVKLDPASETRFFRQKQRTMNEAQAKVVWDYARQQVSLGLGRFGSPNEARCISNWVQVPKPDGTIRPCGGYVQINGMTLLDRSFVPNIEDVFARLKDHRIFFTTDVEAAFQAIPATEEAQKLMALWMPDGSVFFPGTMMFGLKNAPPVFHRNIEVALQGIPDAASYVDDVHGGGVDWASMLLTLRDTCEALHQHGFYLAFRKTHLGADVPLLGYRRTAAGLIADPKRVAEIQSLLLFKATLRSMALGRRWDTLIR